MVKGRLIVLEGGEGSGKSSVLNFLAQQLPEAVVTREPGGTHYAEAIRDLALSPDAKDMDGVTQLLLMFASRRDHVERLIHPMLETGKLVLCDRFVASSWAYNICGQESRENETLFRQLEAAIVGDLPGHYVFLDVPVLVGMERRASARGTSNHFDERKVAFHERVQKGYREYLQDKPHTIIDATQPLEAVCEEALAAVRAATS